MWICNNIEQLITLNTRKWLTNFSVSDKQNHSGNKFVYRECKLVGCPDSRVTKFCVSDRQNHGNKGTCRDFTRPTLQKYFCDHSLCSVGRGDSWHLVTRDDSLHLVTRDDSSHSPFRGEKPENQKTVITIRKGRLLLVNDQGFSQIPLT